MRLLIFIAAAVVLIAGSFTWKAPDWNLDEWWWAFALAAGFVVSVAAFFAGWRASPLAPRHRRLLYACASLASLVTAFPIAYFGFLFFVYSGYCEEEGSSCAPAFFLPVGLGLLGATAVLLLLLVKSVKELRRLQ